MLEFHSLLKRQLKRHFNGASDALCKEWRSFIDDINKAYFQFDDDRKMLERSLDLSSNELVQSNSEIRTIFQAMPDLFFLLDEEGTILDCKGSQTVDFLLPQKNLLGKKIQDVPDSTIKRMFQDAIETMRSSKEMISFEYSISVNKEVRSYEARLVPLQVKKIIVIVRNITAQKLAQESLRESEERYRLTVENINEVIYRINIDDGDPLRGAVQYVSPQIEALLGYRADEFLLMSPDFWLRLVHPDDLPELEVTTQKLYATKNVVMRIYRFRHKKSGEYRWMEDRIVPLLDSSGMVVGLQGASRDVTERKQSEEALVRQKIFYQQLFENSPAGIVLLDERDCVFNTNSAFRDMFQFTTEELKGCLLNDTIVPSDKLDEASKLSADSLSGKVVSRDSVRRRKDGAIIDVNITERKKLEAQLLRTQRLESIGILAGGIAHDLNNVLAPIMMAIDVLKHQIPNETGLKILSSIELSARRGADIVKQVLTFARGSEGERVLLQPKHILNEVRNILQETFPKAIRIKTGIPNDLKLVIAQSTQLHQVLLNLCVNARDAMPSGGTLTLQAKNVHLGENDVLFHPEARTGFYVVFSVSDSGMGIPNDIINKIFDPFFTTKEVGKGTGLGLSTVLGIMKSHGGFINVYSEIEKGTQFTIYLPAAEESQALAEPLRQETLPSGTGQLILMVDDEAAICQIVKTTLEENGYRVLLASNGKEALSVFDQNKKDIQLVITDMAMPVLDGFAMINEFNKINPELKIIGASGLTDTEDLKRIATSNVQAFLQKPFTSEQLLKHVVMVLKEDQPLVA